MVSIIIPCFNQGEFIRETVGSVKNQTYPHWELIIVNDGSDDKHTLSVLKELAAEGYNITDIPNGGVSAARNFGAGMSQGDFLLFLDSDDMIHREYLSAAMSAFEKDSNLDYVYCDIQEFDGGTGYRSLGALKPDKVLLHAVTHVSGIMKRALWESSKGFNVHFLKGWEDWDFLIRITRMNIRSCKIPAGMLLYRIREYSRDKTASRIHNAALEQQVFREHLDAYLELYKEPISILRQHKEQQDMIADLELSKKNIYKTYSYRLGAGLLYPFKTLSKFLHSKK
ncbi:MAG: glycosyltransferase family A protein [Ferruginibacter sp.]